MNKSVHNVAAIKAGKITASMSFDEKVWALCARVPAGRVTTYGRIAAKLNSNASRAVGGALHRNPYAPAVPCHRVVGSDGRLTGFAGGLAKKNALLVREGVPMRGDRVDLARALARL